MSKIKKFTTLLLTLILALSLTACDEKVYTIINDVADSLVSGEDAPEVGQGFASGVIGEGNVTSSAETSPSSFTTSAGVVSFSLDDLPVFDGEPYVVVNDNTPYFTSTDLTTEAFETYSELDDLGRCGVAYANICQELMPTEDRGEIGSVKPSGWVQNKYDFVDGKYIFNRCHLIGFQLAGENANELNLITGTRYMNVDGMLPFENMVADYVHETDGHVLYRVTPIFEGDNLLASGVLMEAMSVEDEGESIEFCVFCYNAQPGVEFDYATGDNWES